MTLNTFPSVRSVVFAPVLANVSLRTKFEGPSSTRSKDMMGPENLNCGSRDADHAHLRVELSS